MRVQELPAEGQALVESFGVQRLVRTNLVGPVVVGDYLLIHAGYAIEKIDSREAAESLELWAELLQDQENWVER